MSLVSLFLACGKNAKRFLCPYCGVITHCSISTKDTAISVKGLCNRVIFKFVTTRHRLQPIVMREPAKAQNGQRTQGPQRLMTPISLGSGVDTQFQAVGSDSVAGGSQERKVRGAWECAPRRIRIHSDPTGKVLNKMAPNSLDLCGFGLRIRVTT